MDFRARHRGYTLIELTVSIGIFSIIMLLATGAYLSLISYTHEARATSTLMTSLSYSIDQMAREVRTGVDYKCGPGDCTAGTTLSLTNDQGDDVTYTLINGAIGRCVNQSACSASTAAALTDPAITVSHLLFYVKGTSSSDDIQPSVVMVVQGQAAVPGSSPVSFSIQTSATERLIDL